MATKPKGVPTITVTRSTEESKAAFLVQLETHFALAPAARATGISRDIVYLWLKTDPAFATAFREVKEAAIDNLEGSFYQRALDGQVVPAIVILKANRARYRESQQQQAAPIQQVIVTYDSPPTHLLPGATDAPTLAHAIGQPALPTGDLPLAIGDGRDVPTSPSGEPYPSAQPLAYPSLPYPTLQVSEDDSLAARGLDERSLGRAQAIEAEYAVIDGVTTDIATPGGS